MPADGRWDLTRYFRGLMSEVYTLTICKGKYLFLLLKLSLWTSLLCVPLGTVDVAEVGNQNGSANRNN